MPWVQPAEKPIISFLRTPRLSVGSLWAPPALLSDGFVSGHVRLGALAPCNLGLMPLWVGATLAVPLFH